VQVVILLIIRHIAFLFSLYATDGANVNWINCKLYTLNPKPIELKTISV